MKVFTPVLLLLAGAGLITSAGAVPTNEPNPGCAGLGYRFDKTRTRIGRLSALGMAQP